MESVIDSLNKLNLHPNQLISLQTLKQLVQHMEDSQTNEVKLSDIMDFIHNVNKGHKASQNDAQTPSSPMFTFQTPSKPFASFVFKKPLGKDENDHRNVLDDSDNADEDNTQTTTTPP
ncbi:hypothetical protein EON65_46130, partial [archaeon]